MLSVPMHFRHYTLSSHITVFDDSSRCYLYGSLSVSEGVLAGVHRCSVSQDRGFSTSAAFQEMSSGVASQTYASAISYIATPCLSGKRNEGELCDNSSNKQIARHANYSPEPTYKLES